MLAASAATHQAGSPPDVFAKAVDARNALDACRQRENEKAEAEKQADAQRQAETQQLKERQDATARQEAADAEWARVLHAHPELPVQSVSAVLCRTEQYRQFALSQIAKDKKYSRIGGTINPRKRNDLQQLVRFLDERKISAVNMLKTCFEAKPLGCSLPLIKSLSTCAGTPELDDDEGHPIAPGPAVECKFVSEHPQWWGSQNETDPSSYWYLGSAWFQPVSAERVGAGESNEPPECPHVEQNGQIDPATAVPSGLSQADLTEEISENQQAFAACVQEQKRRAPTSSGTLWMQWRIQRDGHPTDIKVKSGSDTYPDLAECFKTTIAALRFRAYQAAPVAFPFTF